LPGKVRSHPGGWPLNFRCGCPGRQILPRLDEVLPVKGIIHVCGDLKKTRWPIDTEVAGGTLAATKMPDHGARSCNVTPHQNDRFSYNPHVRISKLHRIDHDALVQKRA
jgi:hypothetical protein